MAGTVVAVFDDNTQAERAAQALVDDGALREDITLVFHGAGGAAGTPHDINSPPDKEALATGVREVETHDVEQPINAVDEVAPRAIVGFVIGAPLGSLAMSLLVFFQSLETSIAAHALAWQLLSGLVGGIAGALLGALTAGGIPKEAARGYHAEIQHGKTLVTVLASSGNAPHFQEILRSNGGRKLGFFPRFLDTIQSVEFVTPSEPGSARPLPTFTTAEAIGKVLTHLERQAGRTNSEAAYAGLLTFPDLPFDALADLGPLTRLEEAPGQDALPSLLLETDSGQTQIEFCPFGPLALLSSDGVADTDPVAQILWDAGLYPLFPADLDAAGLWHGAPLARWLFPIRLSQAFALFETLRTA